MHLDVHFQLVPKRDIKLSIQLGVNEAWDARLRGFLALSLKAMSAPSLRRDATHLHGEAGTFLVPAALHFGELLLQVRFLGASTETPDSGFAEAGAHKSSELLA